MSGHTHSGFPSPSRKPLTVVHRVSLLQVNFLVMTRKAKRSDDFQWDIGNSVVPLILLFFCPRETATTTTTTTGTRTRIRTRTRTRTRTRNYLH